MHQTNGGDSLSRRSFLGAIGAAGAGMLGSRFGFAAEAAPAAPQAFRFVHLTDIHVQPQLKADEGLRKCLAAVHALKPRPDFILTGGDLIFDSLNVPFERARKLWDLYTRVCRDSDIPIRNCIGNHDVFGWGSKKRPTDHPSYGKKLVQDVLEMERTTYSFDHKGWHFSVVDDIQARPEGNYQGAVSEEDLHWLNQDLKQAGKRPKVICAHIPFITVVVFRDAEEKETPMQVSSNRTCRNPGPILKVLRENNVDLVINGHNHQNVSIRYDRTLHLTHGAVCGAWWKGAHFDNPEGFGVIDARPDGTFEHSYQTYGWKAEPVPAGT